MTRNKEAPTVRKGLDCKVGTTGKSLDNSNKPQDGLLAIYLWFVALPILSLLMLLGK